MKEEFKELTAEQKYQADRLAKLTYQKNMGNQRIVDEICKMVSAIPDETIPCDYGIYQVGDIYRFQKIIRRLVRDINEGKIILK